MPSAPRVLFRLLFRLPVKERGLSADAEGNAEDERDGGAEQTEAPGGTADGEHHAAVDPGVCRRGGSRTDGDADVHSVPRAEAILFCTVGAVGKMTVLTAAVQPAALFLHAKEDNGIRVVHIVGVTGKEGVVQLPGKLGKGVLVSPTVHGNTIVGPTAIDIEDREGTNTTAEGLNDLIEKAGATVENLPIRQTITSFAGLRAHEDHHEFVIGEAEGAQQFIDCAGIESPGLTSSPAIGLHVSELMRDLMDLREKAHFIATRRGVLDPKTLSKEDYQQLIREKPAYGQIICRCEQVTEGEILDAIHRPLGAKSLDGVKRRTRAGMGRCQAGFCSPRVMEILARELHVDQSEITKCGGQSRLITGTNKDSIGEVQAK